MGEPTYFDGPDYPDGTDAEGFPDGDQRFGLIKPTKEEVEEIRELIVPFAGSGRLSTRFELIIRLCDAYLALMEELRIEQLSFLVANERNLQIERELYLMESENQALKARLKILEANNAKNMRLD